MDIVLVILTVLGIVLLLYWTGTGIKSVVSKSGSTLETIDIPETLSNSPQAYVNKAFFDPKQNKYIAEVKCPKLGNRSLPVADTLDELWELCKLRISEFMNEIAEE